MLFRGQNIYMKISAYIMQQPTSMIIIQSLYNISAKFSIGAKLKRLKHTGAPRISATPASVPVLLVFLALLLVPFRRR